MGATGLAFDRDDNMYVAAGSKVFKYTPQLQKSVLIDTSVSKIALNWEGLTFDLDVTSLFSLSFDPRKENLYVSDLRSSSLLKYPLLPDGTATVVTSSTRSASERERRGRSRPDSSSCP